MITNALFLGVVFGIIMYFWTRNAAQAGVMALIMSSTAYIGYWSSNRVAVRIARRLRPTEEDPPRLAATTDRPEHVQRRRSRRRPRGRQSVHRD